jgi:hypothetical protein
MTTQRGIGTYLAQGWAANVAVPYLWILGWVLFTSETDILIMMAVMVPIYCFVTGSIGAVVAACIWSFEFARGRRFNIITRALGAILVPSVLITSVVVLGGFRPALTDLPWILLPPIFLTLPPSLLSGVRFNPLSFLVMDLQRDVPDHGWGRALTLLSVPLLRIVSVFGMLEALLCLACLRLPDFGSLDTMGRQFVGAIIAATYFAISLIVALGRPQKIAAIGIGILMNVPLAALAVYVRGHSAGEFQLIAILGWLVIFVWAVFLISQLFQKGTRRLLPVTMFEIRIRHALNYW